MSVLQRGPRRLTVILVKQNVTEAAIVFQVQHAVAVGPKNFFYAFFADGRQTEVVIGSFNDHFVRAYSVHAIEKSIALAVEPAFDAQRRKFIGHHAQTPPRRIFSAAIAAVGQNFGGRLPFTAGTKRTVWRALDFHAFAHEIHRAVRAISGNDDPASGDRVFAKLRQVLAPSLRDNNTPITRWWRAAAHVRNLYSTTAFCTAMYPGAVRIPNRLHLSRSAFPRVKRPFMQPNRWFFSGARFNG